MNLKKIYLSLLTILISFLLIGSSKSEVIELEEEIVNCDLFACLNQIEPEYSIKEINEVIGLDGEVEEFSKNITWELNNKQSITLTYVGDDPLIQANYDRTIIQNMSNDFTVASEIAELLKEGKTITYEEIKEKLGGVEGTLTSKTTDSKTYAWVDKDKRIFKATFKKDSDGRCTIATLGY